METDTPDHTMIPTSGAQGAGFQVPLQRLARWACGLAFEDLPVRKT